METPKSGNIPRTTRQSTPRKVPAKKQLFNADALVSIADEDEFCMTPISSNALTGLENTLKSTPMRMLRSHKTNIDNDKENTLPETEEIQEIFDQIMAEDADIQYPAKRTNEDTTNNKADVSKMQKSSPIEPKCIPVESFYSKNKDTPKSSGSKSSASKHYSPPSRGKSTRRSTVLAGKVNKAVYLKGARMFRTPVSRPKLKPVKWTQILQHMRNERLRQLIANTCAKEQNIERVHDILRNGPNPITLAKPLRTLNADKNPTALQEQSFSSSDFSDLDVECTKNEQLLPDVKLGTNETSPTNECKRKFFKTGHNTNTRKQVSLFENCKAQVYKGKISLMQQQQKKGKHSGRKSQQMSGNVTFSDEHEQVEAILRSLDNMSFSENKTNMEGENVCEFDDTHIECENYKLFKARLPYNTQDAKLMEQQKTLLYFLYMQNILNEENFQIFIAEPDNAEHKQRATEIVDQIYTKISNDNNNAADEQLLDEPLMMEQATEEAATDASLMSETPPAFFPIFYKSNWRPLVAPISTRRSVHATPRGLGVNQLQIDAGQREFGAQQCKQCGLLYSRHEPEEEELHARFHSSQHVLRFKAWIDEDVVAKYPEWSQDGRIIRFRETASAKKLQRLKEILAVVDAELGFSSYIIPNIFVVYFAVRKQHIVGVCLAHPLQKAYKYECVNGVDCCSIEEYPAVCGISRIWVAPLQRRHNIGSKLVDAVQLHTIPNKHIPMEHIAFSAPTEAGRLFAQRVTDCKNFMVYQ